MNPLGLLISKARIFYLIRFAKSVSRQQNIRFPYKLGLRDSDVFLDIFFKRAYAPCFPFYANVNIVDIGAHKGFFTLFAAKNAGIKSRIIAIEPEPDNFNIMQKNIKFNNFENIETLQCAIAGSTGSKSLFLSESVNHSLVQVDNKHPYVKQSGSIVVQTYTLEDLLKNKEINSVKFLKIDCEGGEYEILFNTNDSTFEKIETIALEFHDLSKDDVNIYTLLRFLLSKSYRVISFEFQKTPMPLNMGILIVTRT